MEDKAESKVQAEVMLPKYVCHKEVHAAKITEIVEHESDGTGHRTLMFGEIGGSKFITDAWFDRFKPEIGGYYVVYADGYASFSPAKAFNEGYTRV